MFMVFVQYDFMEVCDHIANDNDNFSLTFTLGMSVCESTCGIIVAEKRGFLAADLLPRSRAYAAFWVT